GANNITGYGSDGTASRHYIGALPPAGQWARLSVPASLVNLEGSTLKGMAFTLFGGAATWDYAGKAAQLPPDTSSTNYVPVVSTNNPTIGGTNNLPTGPDGQPGTGTTNDVVVTNTN